MFLNAFYNIDINSNNFYAFTGTNGKTSAAYLTHQLLQKMNYDSVYIGTLGVKFNKEEIDTSFSKKTTPDIFELFEIVNSINCKMDSINVCMELSSHALDQKRIDKINSVLFFINNKYTFRSLRLSSKYRCLHRFKI